MKLGNKPSVSAHRNAFNAQSFSFSKVSVNDVSNFKKLGNRKAKQSTDIPVKILKTECWHIYHLIFITFLIYVLIKVSFHLYWNMLILHLSLKKDAEVLKKVSAVITKIFEKILCNQITPFLVQFLSIYQCGFWKGFNGQHCLLNMLGKWKKEVDTKSYFGVLLTDLSKAPDYLPHYLITAYVNIMDLVFLH